MGATRTRLATCTTLALLLLLVLTFVVVDSRPTAAGSSDRRWAYANVQASNAFDGISANFETAIPTVRDGGFSAEVIWLYQSGNPNSVEEGWRVQAPSTSPKWYSGNYDNSGNWYMDWEGTPTVGHSYPYKIDNWTSGSWRIYINGTWVRTRTTNMYHGSVAQAGGEVTKYDPSVNSAMGVSGFDSLKYKSASYGTWSPWGMWTQQRVDTADGYHLYMYNWTSFQDYGNNP